MFGRNMSKGSLAKWERGGCMHLDLVHHSNPCVSGCHAVFAVTPSQAHSLNLPSVLLRFSGTSSTVATTLIQTHCCLVQIPDLCG